MSKVLSRLDGPAFEITLNRPEVRNALDVESVHLLLEALGEAERSPARAVILRGAGGSFCSGADLSELADEDANHRDRALQEFGQAFESLCDSIWNLDLPVVAAIEGAALGGGATLAFCCDFRLSTLDLKLGIPASKLGITLSARIVERIWSVAGRRGAADLLLRSKRFGAREALERGLVDEVVESSSSLETRARALVEEVSEGERGCVAAHKHLINELATAGWDRQGVAGLLR